MIPSTDPFLHGAERAAQPITVRVREACRLTGIGRSKLYDLISQGEIAIVKIGVITLIPMDSLTQFIARHDCGKRLDPLTPGRG